MPLQEILERVEDLLALLRIDLVDFPVYRRNHLPNGISLVLELDPTVRTHKLDIRLPVFGLLQQALTWRIGRSMELFGRIRIEYEKLLRFRGFCHFVKIAFGQVFA